MDIASEHLALHVVDKIKKLEGWINANKDHDNYNNACQYLKESNDLLATICKGETPINILEALVKFPGSKVVSGEKLKPVVGQYKVLKLKLDRADKWMKTASDEETRKAFPRYLELLYEVARAYYNNSIKDDGKKEVGSNVNNG